MDIDHTPAEMLRDLERATMACPKCKGSGQHLCTEDAHAGQHPCPACNRTGKVLRFPGLTRECRCVAIRASYDQELPPDPLCNGTSRLPIEGDVTDVLLTALLVEKHSFIMMHDDGVYAVYDSVGGQPIGTGGTPRDALIAAVWAHAERLREAQHD